MGCPAVSFAPEDDALCVWFPYDQKLVEAMRRIPVRRFDRERRVWKIPKKYENNLARVMASVGAPLRRADSPPLAREIACPRTQRIEVQREAGYIGLKHRYDADLLEIERRVPGRVYHMERKYWRIPETEFRTYLDTLHSLGWSGVLWDLDFQREISLEEDDKYVFAPPEYGAAKYEKEDDQQEEEEREKAKLELADLEAAFSETVIPDADISDVRFRAAGGKPMGHQIDFMRFAKAKLAEDPSGILVCDEQGLGKTLEAINLALYLRDTKNIRHCLVICCVNSTVRNWADEIALHTEGEEKAHVLGQTTRRDGSFTIGNTKAKIADLEALLAAGPGEDGFPFFLVTNIETLRGRDSAAEDGGKKPPLFPVKDRLVQLIQTGKIGCVVVDEVHRNTGAGSKQGRALWNMRWQTKKTDCVWVPMTGTPLVNRPSDRFLSLGLAGGHDFDRFSRFRDHFCPSGRKLSDYRNMGELRVALVGKMIRRRKETVLDLPPKTRKIEYIELSPFQKNLYEDLREEMLRELDEDEEYTKRAANPLDLLLKLRQITGSPELISEEHISASGPEYLKRNAKMARLAELVREIVEGGEKCIVFSNWAHPIDVMRPYLNERTEIAVITGRQDPQQRQEAVNRFQTDPQCACVCGTISALGVGLTLTAASHVIFYDEPWTPASREQAEDRAHRIGTTSSVCIHTLLGVNTVDQKVHDLLYDKKQAADLLIDGHMEVGGNTVDLRSDPSLMKRLLLDEEEGEPENQNCL